jgi:hypothetical protein
MMKLFLSNFVLRVADYARNHRRQVIKLVTAVVASLVIAWLVIYAIERFQQWGYEKGVKALELKFNEAEAKAKAAEARAAGLEVLIKANEAEYADLKLKADAADSRLGQTTIVYRTLKEKYEETRDNPDIPACVSYADACAELAGVNHPCK